METVASQPLHIRQLPVNSMDGLVFSIYRVTPRRVTILWTNDEFIRASRTSSSKICVICGCSELQDTLLLALPRRCHRLIAERCRKFNAPIQRPAIVQHSSNFHKDCNGKQSLTSFPEPMILLLNRPITPSLLSSLNMTNQPHQAERQECPG